MVTAASPPMDSTFMVSLARAHENLRLDAEAFGKGIYSASEALRLVNFRREGVGERRVIGRQTIGRWVKGYAYRHGSETRHVARLFEPEYAAADEKDFELSFRDLIELRFIKSFRDYGLSVQTIRTCFERAVEEVRDPRPFSTQKFRTDGQTIFLEITEGVDDAKLVDLKRRQGVFRSFVVPTFKDLEFDADVVARWFPLGKEKRSIVIDPKRAFGRPAVGYGVPTQVLRDAIVAEGSEERVAKAYDLPLAVVRDAAAFERNLAA